MHRIKPVSYATTSKNLTNHAWNSDTDKNGVFPQQPLQLVLDSGAFSAWRQRAPIDVMDYIEFCKEYGKYFVHIVNLDSIPGKGFGIKPTPDEVELSAQIGWDNLLTMQKHGINPMPVFHQGEQLKWLFKLIEHGCDYIGISPANDRTTKQKTDWLDQVFSVICDKDGWPIIKTHGFGVTAVSLLIRFPFYSADSASWAILGGYGKIYVPYHRGGTPVYDHDPYHVHISMRDSTARGKPDHFLSFGTTEQQFILDYLKLHNFTLEDVSENYINRLAHNLMFFSELEQNLPEKPYKPATRKKGFFA